VHCRGLIYIKCLIRCSVYSSQNNACIEFFRDVFSRFYPELMSAIHRRSIADGSGMHLQSFRDMLLFPRHPRNIADASPKYSRFFTTEKQLHLPIVEINIIMIFYSSKGHNENSAIELGVPRDTCVTCPGIFRKLTKGNSKILMIILIKTKSIEDLT